MNPSKNYYTLLVILTLTFFLPGKSAAQIYKDSTATIEARVDDLLGKMTLDGMIGQMVQEEQVTLNTPSDIHSYYLGFVLATANDGPPGHTAEAWANLCDSLQAYA